LLFYYAGYSKIRNFISRLQQKALTRFVTFHDILDCDNFRGVLRSLDEQTNVVSLDDYCSRRLSTKRVNVVITFDDGYKSWVSTAAPALREMGMPATFFVSSGFIGLSQKEERGFIQTRLKKVQKTTGALGEEELMQLNSQGFTIGGHTTNHVNLGKITDRVQLVHEIREDKRKLESLIGKEIRYFSYPYGACRNPEVNVVEIVKAAGYEAAVTTRHGFNTEQTDRFLLRRELTPLPMPITVFKARVLGNYDAIAGLKRMWYDENSLPTQFDYRD
jgi:peptidoglycan/xylan/chitin deacetylase (PgdA/CDA1 family)